MNAILQAQLDRVETALNTLVDSITSYNPSIPAVHELLSADDALTEGLDQLAIHQANHAQILALQTTTTLLDDSLTDILHALAQTRSDILAAPATAFSSSQRPVSHTELLDYATNISRYIAPPGLREKLAAMQQEPRQAVLENGVEQPVKQAESMEPSTDQATQQTNGTNSATSSFPTPFHPAPPSQEPTTIPPTPIAVRNIGVSTLTVPEKHWLEPLMAMPYLPWPSEEVIRRGALSSLTARIESGDDLLGGNGTGDAAEGMVHEQAVGMERTNGTTENGAGTVERGLSRKTEMEKPKPSVFAGLDLYDPDEE
ncbi:hypothetical protein MMC13_006070 [Lambiella insularis]|nr:hypothetical protein [Lambiella insularis]